MKKTKYDIVFGDQYNKWSKGEQLGKGEYGTVYIFTKKSKRVAIKQFPKEKEGSKGEFEIEVKAFRETGKHRHIVEFLEAFETPGEYSIALEFCPEGSLERMLNQKYSELDVREVVLQCTQALLHLKRFGYVHRDIKPENIFVRSWKPINVALGDFNYAKGVNNANHTTVMMTNLGSAAYKAPELDDRVFRRRNKHYNYKVDVFALGIVAYELISGWRPRYDLPIERSDAIEQKYQYNHLKYKLNIQKIKALKAYYEELSKTGVPMEGEQWDLVSVDAKTVIGQMILPLYQKRCNYEYILKSKWFTRDLSKASRLN